MTEMPKPKRRWFRFSLRTLLIVVVLLSLPLGWFAMKMARAERQRRAVEAIERVGGWIQYDCCVDESGKPQPSVSTWLTGLVGVHSFVHVVTVSMYESEPPDVVFEHLTGLTELEWLNLPNAQITDAKLEYFTGLKRLRFLDLANAHVTAEGIGRLQKALPDCHIQWKGSPHHFTPS